jgi:hypothetical protein
MLQLNVQLRPHCFITTVKSAGLHAYNRSVILSRRFAKQDGEEITRFCRCAAVPSEVYLLLRRVARNLLWLRHKLKTISNREVIKEGMMEVIILLVVLAALDIASWRWGSNSNDGISSPEWERRQRWYGFH